MQSHFIHKYIKAQTATRSFCYLPPIMFPLDTVPLTPKAEGTWSLPSKCPSPPQARRAMISNADIPELPFLLNDQSIDRADLQSCTMLKPRSTYGSSAFTASFRSLNGNVDKNDTKDAVVLPLSGRLDGRRSFSKTAYA